MLKNQALEIMEKVSLLYPYWMSKKKPEEIAATLDMWAEVIIRFDYELARTAIWDLCRNHRKDFPPNPGEMTHCCREATKRERMKADTLALPESDSSEETRAVGKVAIRSIIDGIGGE